MLVVGFLHTGPPRPIRGRLSPGRNRLKSAAGLGEAARIHRIAHCPTLLPRTVECPKGHFRDCPTDFSGLKRPAPDHSGYECELAPEGLILGMGAIQVTLSRKGAKSQAQSRSARSTATSTRARPGGMRESRADLEKKLEARTQELAEARESSRPRLPTSSRSSAARLSICRRCLIRWSNRPPDFVTPTTL
jgi:hypothetical protein